MSLGPRQAQRLGDPGLFAQGVGHLSDPGCQGLALNDCHSVLFIVQFLMGEMKCVNVVKERLFHHEGQRLLEMLHLLRGHAHHQAPQSISRQGNNRIVG